MSPLTSFFVVHRVTKFLFAGHLVEDVFVFALHLLAWRRLSAVCLMKLHSVNCNRVEKRRTGEDSEPKKKKRERT